MILLANPDEPDDKEREMKEKEEPTGEGLLRGEQYLALQQRREQEETKDFKQVYASSLGIEGTISQGVRVMGLRRSRYIGQERMHLQHVATAAALNLVRSMAWFSGLPRAQTRRSAFVRLYDAA